MAQFQDVPGQVAVKITILSPDDPRRNITLPDGQVRNVAISLAKLREQLGGDEGDWVDPAMGRTHHISLKTLAHMDPNKTYVRLSFTFTPEKPTP